MQHMAPEHPEWDGTQSDASSGALSGSTGVPVSIPFLQRRFRSLGAVLSSGDRIAGRRESELQLLLIPPRVLR